MFKELHTKRFHLTKCGLLAVYDYQLCRRINRYLKTYDDGHYVFRPGEEALFRLNVGRQDQYKHILSTFLAPRSIS